MSNPDGNEPTLAPTLAPEPTAAPPAHREAPGPGFPVPQWDRYEFLALLGQGGMGEVFRARDRRLGRVVALKFIRGADPDQVMRFLQEARAQARIDHPHVCKVLEVGEVGGKAYIAMPLVGGERLDRAAQGMTLPERIQVLLDVTRAIHAAHRLGIVHRDLKPSNILVERADDGRWSPVVLDFGLAHDLSQGHGLTRTGALLGTPSYMAPEQARGDVRAIDRRSDVYSLGATLYEVLTGVAPFVDESLVGTLHKVLHEEPVPPRVHVPHLPEDLEILVLKCLSKEPEQRYDSARALAEDLARYLEGEPILGQRPSLVYRLRRRAARHRALVLLSAASLAAILVLSAFGARSWLEARATRQRSEERAQLAGQLGQQVKEIEWFLRAAQTLPLHDTTPEQRRVRERMERIASRPHALGEPGEGLVHYALGRGYLALDELERAHAELTRARRQGVDSPELHHALGRVLGELYSRALEDARRRGGQAWVAEQRRVLETRYLEPALQSLGRSRELELESPPYLEGLIAFYRRDYDAAERLAQQAARETPWVYEAHRLAGDVASARAVEHLEHGDYEPARAQLEEAERRYARALESGRSDARNHEALSRVWLRRAEIDSRQGRSRKDALARALAAADQGLTAAPLRASVYTQKALALMQWYRLMNFEKGGLAPEPILTEWTATALRAVKLAPEDAEAHDTLGYSHFMRALRLASEGAAPDAAWADAISWLSRALELLPEYPWGHNDLAQVYRWKGNYAWEHGGDPREAYARAEHHLLQAARSDPAYLFAHMNLVDVYSQRAAYTLSRGGDPGEDVRRALAAGERALALDGNHFKLHDDLALAQLKLARYLVDTGGEPRAALNEAFAHLERSAALNPTFGRTPLYRALAHLLEVDQALREGGDPTKALEAGRRALAEANRLDSGWVECRLVGARLALAEADWAKRRGHSERPALDRARDEARRAVQLYPYTESHQQLARVYWRRGELTEGLVQVEQALRLDPHLASAQAVRGCLLLERAKGLRGPERLALLRDARSALHEALVLNPLLRSEHEVPLREVDALLSGDGGARRE